MKQLRLMIPACLALMFTLHTATPAQAVLPQLSPQKLAGGFAQPVHITHAGDGSGRLFVVEQPGRIRIVKNGLTLAAPLLDISATAANPGDRKVLFGGERGLLSVAFPPNFVQKGYFYVNYTRQPDGATVVARYFVTANPDVANPASEQVVITIAQPFANHNGGQLAFGPADGLLYIGMGDGGGGGDPLGNAQNPLSLLGKMLRMDVEGPGCVTNPPRVPRNYCIPPANPFVANPAFQPEIWALGLRNPFRFSFDSLTGDLYIGDVGQNLFEEIDFQPASSGGGQNYGWNIMEGLSCFNNTNPPASFSSPLATCNQAGLTLPILAYNHTSGDRAVTGGHVYRGPVARAMRGVYFHSDFATGRIRWLRQTGGTPEQGLSLVRPFQITTFGLDSLGQLYVSDYGRGDVHKLAPQTLVTGDFNGDSVADVAYVNAAGAVFYSGVGMTSFTNVQGAATFAQVIPGDFNGNGRTDLAALGPQGSVWISTNLLSFAQVQGRLTDAVSGDFSADPGEEMAGLDANGGIWLSTKNQAGSIINFSPIPGRLSTIVAADLDGDGTGDLAGLADDGSVWWTTDLLTWTSIPGRLSRLIAGDFNPARPGKELSGLARDSTIWVTSNMASFFQIPGSLVQLVSGDLNGDGRDDLAGLAANGSVYFSLNLNAWTNTPGTLDQLVVGPFGSAAPEDMVGMSGGTLWRSTDRATWVPVFAPLP